MNCTAPALCSSVFRNDESVPPARLGAGWSVRAANRPLGKGAASLLGSGSCPAAVAPGRGTGAAEFIDLDSRLCVLAGAVGDSWEAAVATRPLVGRPVSELEDPNPGWWPEAVAWSRGFRGRLLTVKCCLTRGTLEDEWLELIFCGLRPDGVPDGHRVLVRALSGETAEVELLRRALDRERQRGQARVRLMTMVSHELRNPLTATVCAAEILRMKAVANGAEDGEFLEYVETIFSSSGRMTRLMDELLLLARLESGQLTFQPAWVSPLMLCRKLRDEVGIVEVRDRVTITSALPEDSRFALDPALVRHILMNLLSNALKYSPADAPVEIRIAADAGMLRISVEDRGIGIPPGDQARLFEEFFRASNVGNVRGTGVGLNIAQECARLHGGRLSFLSVPGCGTTFTVEIPRD